MSIREEFIQRGAAYMSEERPGIWPIPAYAEDRLRDWFNRLEDPKTDYDSIASGGFVLRKFVDENGDIEFQLDRNFLTLNECDNPEDDIIFDFKNPGRN